MAEVKARISVDAQDALKRIEEINRASGYASASMSKMAKEIGEANAALSSLGGKMGGTASETAFRNIAEQLERQALAYKLVDGESKGAASSATLYRNAILNLTKQGSLTKEQTDELVRTYNSYRTAAESAKVGTERFAKAQTGVGDAAAKVGRTLKDSERTTDSYGRKLVSIAGNILKFQLLMGPITAAIRGMKDAIADSVKVAAEAEQIFSKLSTVFTGLERSANGMAQSLASSLGVAGSTAASALSTVGDLLQAQGMGTADSLTTASSWISRFQDIIAFKDINMSLEEFAQNFMSGAAGNLRNFRTFGSIVKESAVQARLAAQGLDKLTGSQLELAKMTARAEMALEQQANAIGATEREWDTMLSVNRRLNEEQKEFKENLGDSINRWMKPIKSWWTDILSEINKVISAQEQYADGLRRISEFNVTDNEDDRRAMQQAFRSLGRENQGIFSNTQWWGRQGSNYRYGASDDELRNLFGNTSTYFDQAIDELDRFIVMYGMSVEQFTREIKLMGLEGKISANVLNILTEKEKERNKVLEEEAKASDAAALILSQGQSIDAFTESLASLFGVNAKSTNLAAVGEGVNEYNYEDLLQSFGLTASNQMNTVMSSVLRQVAGLGTDAFLTDIEKAFGTGDTQKAYGTWLEEIVSLYTILYNREVKFGDVGQDTLDTVIDMWGMANGELQDYLKGLDEAAAKDKALKEAESAAASYRTTLNNYGLSDFAVKRNELQGRIDNAKSGAEANLWSDALRDFVTVTAKELEDSFSGLAYEAEIATIGMTDNEKALYELDQQYNKALASLEETGEDTSKLTANYKAQKASLEELQRLQKEYNDELERQAAVITGIENARTAEALMASFEQGIAPLQATGIYASADTWRAGQRASLRNTEAQLLALGVGADKVNGFIKRMTPLINDEYEAKKKEIDASIEAAEALRRLNAWQALGRKALGSMGTVGGVVQTLTDENGGDIWTRILSAVLDILQKSEYWEDVVEILNMVIEPILPLVNMIAYTLKNLEPVFRAIGAIVGSIGVVVATILAGVNYVIDFFKWGFAWLGTAFHNLGEVIAHPLNANRRNTEALPKLADYTRETTEQYAKTINEISDAVYGIKRNTDDDGDDYAKQLALLKNLYDNGVLTGEQYRGQIASVTGGSMGAVETYRGQSYATGSGGVTYYSGDIVINGYNKDPKELALEIERILQQRAQAGGNLIA